MGAELHLELRSNNAVSTYPLNSDHIEFGRNGSRTSPLRDPTQASECQLGHFSLAGGGLGL